MSSVQEFQAGNIERMGQILAYALETTRDDKRDWKPEAEGAAGVRSALDQIAECITVNRMLAGVFRSETPPPPPPGGGPMQAPRTFATVEEAQAQLRDSAKELADAVRGLSDTDLQREFPSRRGPMPGIRLIEIPYRNMAYHWGQINLIQLLYGDTEFHIPPPPEAKPS